jgi:hypothetical protein
MRSPELSSPSAPSPPPLRLRPVPPPHLRLLLLLAPTPIIRRGQARRGRGRPASPTLPAQPAHIIVTSGTMLMTKFSTYYCSN